ncbi:HNH endonuclease [Mycoplasmopsis hyopharyngis]|uniref:HNH endonuclease n=1 Tax=Mycoplasmopsis hyopharyngis TaxID=29558 RepID=UPI003872D634
MIINKETGLKLWNKKYRKSNTLVKDFAGREMAKGLYGINTKKGWNIDHIKPLSLGGSSNESNL